MTSSYIITILVIAIIVIFALLLSSKYSGVRRPWTPSEKVAGMVGEHEATKYITGILREHDKLLTNVELYYDGKSAECDMVIINTSGIYIIETKNWEGKVSGNVDDYEWKKIKFTKAGNIYFKSLKNPINQVKRQVYILSKTLKANGINVWIEGYVFFLNNNAPCTNEHILHNRSDIDRAIHSGKTQLTSYEISKIVKILQGK